MIRALILTAALIAGIGPAVGQDKPKRLIQLPSFGQGSNEAQAPAAAIAAEDKVMAVLAKPFNDLADFLQSDAAPAAALSTAIPDLQDGHGQQCWMAMGTAASVFKAHPVPLTLRAMTDFEALRLLGMAANRLCANTHCTVVFADATSMAQAASPIPLIIPSLHDLCAKVPQVSLAPAVPAAPPATSP